MLCVSLTLSTDMPDIGAADQPLTVCVTLPENAVAEAKDALPLDGDPHRIRLDLKPGETRTIPLKQPPRQRNGEGTA